jgi:prepilin-type processing-associated H-X9-DG protein
VEICPSLNYSSSHFKLKARGAAYGYGYNVSLAPSQTNIVNVASIRDASRVALFADAAQINDFQWPASPDNPLLEEWYYVDGGGLTSYPDYPNGHFRHQQRANVVFADGHVEREKPVPGSIDARLPNEWVGRLRPEILKLDWP